MQRFVVRSVQQGLDLIRHPAIEENFAKALRWRPRNRVAVLVPCAGTKPFPAAPSHSAGYLPALEDKKVDIWVVSEPLGVVPYAWSERWPNDAYDYPPRFLRGEAWDALSERVAEWLERVAPKYRTVYAALPGHHERLLRAALELHNPGNVFDAGRGQCLESGACPPGHGRATSKKYRSFLSEVVRNPSVRRNSDERLAEAERQVKQGRLEAVPELIAGLRRVDRVAPWDALVLWRGTLVGTGEAAPTIDAGKEVQAIAVIEPRPGRAGWADPRVAVYMPVVGPRGPGWAPVGFGVSGIPDWVTHLVNAPRLLPRPPRPRRRRNSDERLRRLERAALMGDLDAQERLARERSRVAGLTPPSRMLTVSPSRDAAWTTAVLGAMEETAWLRIENWLEDRVPVDALGDGRTQLAFAIHVLQNDWRGMSTVWILDDFDPEGELRPDMPSKGEAIELWERIIPCHERRILLAGAWGRLTSQQRYALVDHFGEWVEADLTSLPCVDVPTARNRPRSRS